MITTIYYRSLPLYSVAAIHHTARVCGAAGKKYSWEIFRSPMNIFYTVIYRYRITTPDRGGGCVCGIYHGSACYAHHSRGCCCLPRFPDCRLWL